LFKQITLPNGITLHYVEQGSGAPVIFVHGVAQREIHAGPGRRYAPAQKHKQTMASRIMPGNIPTNFSNSSVSNRGIKEQSKINCLADAHLLALKASTLRMMRWSEKISHSAFMSAISAGLASLAPMARAMLV
jgi:hypothetical protein